MWIEIGWQPRLWWVSMAGDTAQAAFAHYVDDLMQEHGPEKGNRIIELASARLAEEGGGSLGQWVEAIQWALISVDGQSPRLN